VVLLMREREVGREKKRQPREKGEKVQGVVGLARFFNARPFPLVRARDGRGVGQTTPSRATTGL